MDSYFDITHSKILETHGFVPHVAFFLVLLVIFLLSHRTIMDVSDHGASGVGSMLQRRLSICEYAPIELSALDNEALNGNKVWKGN